MFEDVEIVVEETCCVFVAGSVSTGVGDGTSAESMWLASTLKLSSEVSVTAIGKLISAVSEGVEEDVAATLVPRS